MGYVLQKYFLGIEILAELSPNSVLYVNLFCWSTNVSSYFRKECLFLKFYPLKKGDHSSVDDYFVNNNRVQDNPLK